MTTWAETPKEDWEMIPIKLFDKEWERMVSADYLRDKYGVSISRVLWLNDTIQIESTTPFEVRAENGIYKPISFNNDTRVIQSQIQTQGISKILIGDEYDSSIEIVWVKKDENWEETDFLSLSMRCFRAPEWYFHIGDIFIDFWTMPESQDLFFPLEMREAFWEWKKAWIDIWNNDRLRSAPRLCIWFKSQERASYIIEDWMWDYGWKKKLIWYLCKLVPQVETSPLDSRIRNNKITYDDLTSNVTFQRELKEMLPYISEISVQKLKEILIYWKNLTLSTKEIGILGYVPDWDQRQKDHNAIRYGRIPKKTDWISFFRLYFNERDGSVLHISDGSILDIPIEDSESTN